MEKFIGTPGLAARVASTTESVCSLPAVPTQDWCDDAASAVARGLVGFVVGVAIGEVSSTGEVQRLEAWGAASSPGATLQIESMRARMAALERVERAESSGAPRVSRAGSDPARAGPVGVCSIAPQRPGRVLIVEAAPLAEGAAVTPDDEIVLGAALEPLARRARIAFGDEPLAPRQMLTPRERDVLTLLIMGQSVREIASSLSRSPHTIHDYVKSLHRKLSASSRGGLVARALGRPAEPREAPNGVPHAQESARRGTSGRNMVAA